MSFKPSDHLSLNKPIATDGKPEIARYCFYDKDLFIYRPFRTLEEVFLYFPTEKSRKFLQSVLVNTGGTIENGVITGGTNEEYWWKDNYTNQGLVLKNITSTIVETEEIVGETPIGLIDGSNTDFISLFNFIPESLIVIVNGLTMKNFDDYMNIGTQLIRLNFSMQIGENIIINYKKQ